jgi:hypothetical protein
MLPGVRFKIQNGALKGQNVSQDGVSGVILTGVAGSAGVAPTWELTVESAPSAALTLGFNFPDGSVLSLAIAGTETIAQIAEAISNLVKVGYTFELTAEAVVLITAPLSLAETVVSGDFGIDYGSFISVSNFNAGTKPGIELNKAYKVTMLSQAETLGITATGSNSFAYKIISDFYKMAAEGSELYFFLVSNSVLMSQMIDKDYGIIANFQTQTKGRVRNLTITRIASAEFNAGPNSLDEDVATAVRMGEITRLYYVEKMKPFRLIVDGKNFTGNSEALIDWRTENNSGVAIFIASSTASNNASVGLLLGSKAQQPVQRKVSRVKNGKLPIDAAFLTNLENSEDEEAIWDELHKKGYIFIRTYPHKTGLFFSSDTTCTSLTDDYSSLARGSVIDKGMIIAYLVFVEEIDDEIDTDDNGDLDAGQVKDLQSTIEETLGARMVQNKECTSAICVIDPNQDTNSSGNLDIILRIKPRGYKTYINVNLGFTL